MRASRGGAGRGGRLAVGANGRVIPRRRAMADGDEAAVHAYLSGLVLECDAVSTREEAHEGVPSLRDQCVAALARPAPASSPALWRRVYGHGMREVRVLFRLALTGTAPGHALPHARRAVRLERHAH